MASLSELHKQSYSDMPFDEFAQKYHQKFYADIPYDQFLTKAGGAPQREVVVEDPIKATVRKEYHAFQEEERKSGYSPARSPYVRRFIQGATLGFGDELLAGAVTPLEMIARKTLNPAEAYAYAKARQDVELEDARKQTGLLGGVAEGVGSVFTGGALLKSGASFLPKAGTAGPLKTAGAMAADGAVLGGTTGFGEGTGSGRISGAVEGATVGGLLGGAIPLVAPAVNAVARNTLGAVHAKIAPEDFAKKQVARALSESGRAPQEVVREVVDANAAGQPFTLADALGNPGQRMLSTVARAPGPGRTQVVDFLDTRQAGQGRRLSGLLSDGLDAPVTGSQATKAMKEARNAEASVNYDLARGSAGAVDVSPAIAITDKTLSPGVTGLLRPGSGIADDSIEAALRKARSYLTDGKSVLTDFDSVLRSKRELDNIIERASPSIQREIIPVRNAVDDALAKASEPYANARNQFRDASKAIDAVDAGRAAATRGRVEDNLRTYGGLSSREQAGYRTGYADPLIEKVQGSAAGVNKARDFTSDAFQAELPVLSQFQGPRLPGAQDELLKRIGRENTMFETRAAATGGSKTADNLADASSMGVSPEIITQLLSGNLLGAGKNFVARSSDTLSGYTPAVRERVAKILLQQGDPRIESMIEGLLARAAKSDETAKVIRRGLLSAGIVGGENIRSPSKGGPGTARPQMK